MKRRSLAVFALAGIAIGGVISAGGWGPAGLTPAFLKAKGYTRMPGTGIHSVTVPGAVAGWEALRSRFGKLPLSDLLAPAIFYADEGFPVTDVISRAWAGQIGK